MNTSHKQENDATQEELKDVLMDFWRGIMEDANLDTPERMKASELLAKFFLLEKMTRKKGAFPLRPATSDVLRIVEQLEKLQEDPDDDEP